MPGAGAEEDEEEAEVGEELEGGGGLEKVVRVDEMVSEGDGDGELPKRDAGGIGEAETSVEETGRLVTEGDTDITAKGWMWTGMRDEEEFEFDKLELELERERVSEADMEGVMVTA